MQIRARSRVGERDFLVELDAEARLFRRTTKPSSQRIGFLRMMRRSRRLNAV
jgi:hypothetical protein